MKIIDDVLTVLIYNFVLIGEIPTLCVRYKKELSYKVYFSGVDSDY